MGIELAAGRAVPLRTVRTSLAELLSSALEALKRQANENDVDLQVMAASDVPDDALVDPEKIAWCVTTLVGNALRYVRRGTRRLPGGCISVDVRYDAARRSIDIAVDDDGPGIPQEKLGKLFVREAGALHAAGLGLMLVHDVVGAHGGTIDVKSSVDPGDHGTRITLRLPADAERSST